MKLVIFTFILTVLSGLANASPFGIKRTIQITDLINEEVLPSLTEAELSEIQVRIDEFNRSPYIQVADSSDNISIKAICVGGKAAVLVLGIQGFKCVTSTKRIITITMSGERYSPAVTGLIAEGYAGFNAGLSVLAGVAIFSCPTNECGDLRGSYGFYDSRRDDDIDGGTINGAFGLYGAYVASYTRGNSSVSIYAYQAGYAFEIAASQIQVD